MTKVGLVLEGGAMRGMYTAGVLDTMMDNKINVDGIIGVSAGALFGPNYYSNQKGRVLRYNKRFCKDRRYMSLLNFVFTGNAIGKKFAFYDVTTKYDLFDNDTFMKNNTGYYVTATNVETGKADYFEIKNVLEEMEKLRATSAIPLVSKMVKIDKHKYLDGGVSDSIPIEKCQSLGYEKIIVVLTRPLDYRKEPLSERKIKLIQKRYKNYPNLVKAMKNRHVEYNKTIEKIMDMENKKKIFVIRPSEPINVKVIERNPDKLQEVYDLGTKDAKRIMKDLKKYLKNC
ncbi:MAG: patatin family protein [Firmicutes bacterium]|nr:patatin family protein [Bacillota bacterium]